MMGLKNEILIAKAKLKELKDQAYDNEVRAEQLLIMIRELLSPHTDFLDMKIHDAQILLSDFRKLQDTMREITDQIRDLEKELS